MEILKIRQAELLVSKYIELLLQGVYNHQGPVYPNRLPEHVVLPRLYQTGCVPNQIGERHLAGAVFRRGLDLQQVCDQADGIEKSPAIAGLSFYNGGSFFTGPVIKILQLLQCQLSGPR